MFTTKILLGLLVAMFLINRLLNSRVSVKDRNAKPEPRYYVMISLAFVEIAIILIYIINHDIFKFAYYQFPGPLNMAGELLLLTGMMLWIWSVVSLGKHWSPVIATLDDHMVIRTGPYRRVRHPVYASYIVITTGVFLSTGNFALTIICLIITILIIFRIQEEEAFLVKELGNDYKRYMDETGRLFPKIWQ